MSKDGEGSPSKGTIMGLMLPWGLKLQLKMIPTAQGRQVVLESLNTGPRLQAHRSTCLGISKNQTQNQLCGEQLQGLLKRVTREIRHCHLSRTHSAWDRGSGTYSKR